MRTEDPFDDAREQFGRLLNLGRRGGRRVVVFVLAGILALIVASGSYYQVEPDEVGVILRFGEHVPPDAMPGPHFKLPFIDEVLKIPVERQLKMEFGFRTTRAATRSEFSRDVQSVAEAKMLTADRNVAIVEWIVQYKIDDPRKYLFNFRNIDATLRLMVEATMRAVVGDYTVDELITGGREEVEDEARKLLQALNARYDTGIIIHQLKLQDANVPDPVKPSLREVEEAKQEKAEALNLAERERNRVIPEAKGRALEAIATAEGYRIARVNEALGDAERFKALYAQYRSAKDVTRTRLYLEAMSEILPRAKKKILVDSDTKGLVPLLNIATGGGK